MSETKTLLLVDDEKDIRSLLKLWLEGEGFIIKEAVDGKDALKKLKTLRPDLILLDMLMPGMSPKELLGSLKERHSDIPIIYLSAVTSLNGAINKNGFTLKVEPPVYGFILKPTTKILLLNKVKEVLRKTSQM